jgi:hypothetical protein
LECGLDLFDLNIFPLTLFAARVLSKTRVIRPEFASNYIGDLEFISTLPDNGRHLSISRYRKKLTADGLSDHQIEN